MSSSSVERVEDFIAWLSNGFLNYDTALVQKAAAKLYYALIMLGTQKGFYQIPGLSKSTVSRSRSKLLEDGIFYEIFSKAISGTEKRTSFLIPLHPHPLIKWIAIHKTLTDMTMLRDRFGVIIDELESAWQENFGAFLQEKCCFPVRDWSSYVTYGNLLGWLLSCKSQLQKVILLTPHLKLLRDPWSREIILELSKDIEFEFFAFLSSVDEEIKTILQGSSIKIWTLNPGDRDIVINLHTARAGVMINKEQIPFLSFEAQKIPETKSYVGVVHIKCEHVQNTLRALENLKIVAEQYVPELLQAP